MNIKFSFDETNVQVGFENQFVIKDMTEDTLVKILMLKGEKGDTVSAQWGTIIGNLTDQTDLKNALNSKANASDLNTTNSNVATNTSNIGSNTNKIAENTADIEDNAEDIAELQTQVGNLNNLKTTDKTNLVNAINEINVPSKWVSVGAEAPTDGRRVWFKKSKNLFRAGDTATINGVTFTKNADGTYNIVGTASPTANLDIYEDVNYTGLENGVVYTSTATKTLPSGVNITVEGYNGTLWVRAILTSNGIPKQTTINLANVTRVRYRIQVVENTTVNIEQLGYMIQKGRTATPYEPYIKPSINVDEEEWYNPNNIEKYSIDEIKIGTWIDGKPLYRKVLSVASSQFYGNTALINHNISNLKCVINQRFIWTRTDGSYQYRQLPSIYYGNTEWSAQTYVTGTQVVFELGSTIANRLQNNSANCYIILEYTKTTD